MQEEVCKVAEAAIKAIGMQNGPTHTEIKITSSGAKLVEIAARLGGDYITSKLVPLSVGVDMIGCSFASLLGENVQFQAVSDRGAAIRFIQGKEGILKAVEGIEEVKEMLGVQEVDIYLKPGDVINTLKSSGDRVGHVIATGKDAYEAAHNSEAALEKIRVCVE